MQPPDEFPMYAKPLMPARCASGWVFVLIGTWFMPGLATAQVENYGKHPDAARELESRRARLELTDWLAAQQARQQDEATARRLRTLSLHLWANGWGVIVKPDGAAAIVRGMGPDQPPIAVFAPAGTLNPQVIRLRLARAVTQPKPPQEEVPLTARLAPADEPPGPIFAVPDLELWNEIVSQLEPALGGPVPLARFRPVAMQFPLRIRIPDAP